MQRSRRNHEDCILQPPADTIASHIKKNTISPLCVDTFHQYKAISLGITRLHSFDISIAIPCVCEHGSDIHPCDIEVIDRAGKPQLYID